MSGTKGTTTVDADESGSVRVVAIGASAGGLEAFTQLLGHLPVDGGLAYVLVQHLDPVHESILAGLLARATTIPVLQATDGQRVEADHVYVIPPGTDMTLADGHLELVPREKTDGPARSIDVFFSSVAEAQGSDAIGVVLSGTGSDGAAGLQAIKAAGGVTFAQTPESAGYDGMPRAAAATGCVDFVLSPSEIAARLTGTPHPEPPRPDDPTPPARVDDALGTIFDVLRRHTGVDFAQYKLGTIQRRILRRMGLRNIDALADYAAALRTDTAEVDALYGDLLIGVTKFFRDPELFTALSETVIPEMLQRREPGGAIRIWVPGCATGQEAYSLAISVVESLGDAPNATPIQLFATDLSEAAITMARAGLYPHAIEADISPERLRRFFVKEAHGYRVAKAIRELCIFAPQNIARDPPFSQLDLISCRNVLIYLQPALHDRIFALFHYALRPGGILVLGSSESTGVASALFSPIDKKQRIYARQATLGRSTFPDFPDFPASFRTNARAGPTTEAAARPRSVHEVQRAADQIVLGSYAPAGVVVDDQLQIVQFRGRTGDFLEPAAGSASFDLMGMTRRDLRAELRAAIQQARTEGSVTRREGVPVQDDPKGRYVDMEVIPFRVISSDAQFFVVLFEDVDRATATRRHARQRRIRRRSDERRDGLGSKGVPSSALEQELDAARRRLQEVTEEYGFAIGELQAANEEVQSANEELQSTNEELETAKEELQSANEELATLNDELRVRNDDLGSLNDDLTNLLTSMRVPTIIVGADLRIRRFTAGAERLMNISASDVGRRIGDLDPSVAAPELEKLVSEVVDTLAVQEREVRDRQGCWYSMLIRPYRTADHTIGGAVIVYQDIDDRKHHAERLDEARRYADAIVETIREPLLVLDATFRVQRANRAFYEMFQTSAAETEARSLFELGEGQWDIARLRTLRDEMLHGEMSLTGIEVEHEFPAIGRRVLLLNSRRIVEDDARTPRILLAIEDITARRDFERRELFLSEAAAVLGGSVDYATTMEAIGSIAVPMFAEWCVVDMIEPDGAVLRSETVYGGAEARGVAGAGSRRAMMASDHPVSIVLRTGKPFILEEVRASYLEPGVWEADEMARLRALDPRSLLIVPLTSGGGHILGAMTLASARSGSARSYTRDDLAVAQEFARRAAHAIEAAAHYRDMATARLSAEAANRVKSEFLASMSHELRTPLNAILGYVQLLEMEVTGPITDKQREHLHRIEHSQQHLLGLIEDVLQFAKIEAGRVDMQMAVIPIHEAISEAASLATPQMQRKGLRYRYEPCDEDVRVLGDHARIRQVVLNLLSNAMKFTGEDGTVSLECTASETDVVIRVTDTGIGIPQNMLELAFEPFVQLDSTLTRRADGSGLGLAISRSFAREMGGDLTAASVVGEGSSFSFRLPRAPAPDASPSD
jgi:two-component system CheB/CheR fusion protein